MKMKLLELYGVLMIQYHETNRCPYVTLDNEVFIPVKDFCKIEGCLEISSARIEDSEVKLMEGRYQSVPLNPPLLCLTLASTTLTPDGEVDICNTFGESITICAEECFDYDGSPNGVCLVVKLPIFK